MNQMKIFFDTNVLVYAHDRSAIQHTESALLLTKVFENKIRGILAEQNIIELYRVLTNPKAMRGCPLTPMETKNFLVETYLSRSFEICYPIASTIREVLDLAANRNVISAKIFDLRIAALAINQSIDYLATYNTNDFKDIDHLVPMEPSQILPKIA